MCDKNKIKSILLRKFYTWVRVGGRGAGCETFLVDAMKVSLEW